MVRVSEDAIEIGFVRFVEPLTAESSTSCSINLIECSIWACVLGLAEGRLRLCHLSKDSCTVAFKHHAGK